MRAQAWVDKLLADRKAAEPATRRALVVDEANKLNWTLPRGAALPGRRRATWPSCSWEQRLYEQQFVHARTRDLLLQLGRA